MQPAKVPGIPGLLWLTSTETDFWTSMSAVQPTAGRNAGKTCYLSTTETLLLQKVLPNMASTIPPIPFTAAFFDYDKDGDLDLFLLNHSVGNFDRTMTELKNDRDPSYEERLYKNNGGEFVDVTKEAGMVQKVMNYGLGIAVADFNNDNWPDIYICNDYFEQDYLYINQKNGTFSEQLEKYFDHVSFASMGNDAADINNDGYIDLVTLDMYPEDNYGQKLVAGPDNYDKYSILKKTGFYHQRPVICYS